MKGLIGLTCLCWLLASVGYTIQTLAGSSGQTFTYEVESTVLSGIPESANQYSGLSLIYKLKLDVVGKNKAVFKIQDVRVGKLNEEVPVSYAEDIEFQHSPSPHYERELSKPIIVHFDEHQVNKIQAQKSDPTWSVNIKKALVEKFQVDLKKQNLPAVSAHSNFVPKLDPASSIYSVYEDGIGGDCETRYSLLSVQSLDEPDMSEDVLNVTKVKNYRNCRSRPVFEFDNIEYQGCTSVCEPKHAPLSKKLPEIWRESTSAYESGCHFGFEPDHHPVKSYSIVWYNISSASHSPIIEGILAEGKTVYNLNGMEIMVVAQQNITLVKKTGLRSEIPTIANPVTYNSLEYVLPEEEYLDTDDSRIYALFGPVHIPDLVEVTIRQIEGLVHDIIPTEPETSQAAGTKVIQVVNALNVFKRPELETIYHHLESDKVQKVPRKQEMMRKVFLDLVAIAASDEAALFVRDLIISKRVAIWEAAELVEGIGKNSDEPSDEVIEAFFKLLDRPRVQQSHRLLPAVGIALAKMIEDSCVDNDEPKLQQFLDRPHKQPGGRYPRSVKKQKSSEESSIESQEKQPRKHPKEITIPVDEPQCTPAELKSYIKIVAQKLHDAKNINKIIVYVEMLAHMNAPEVLPYLIPYISGEAHNADALEDEDTDFLRTATIYALHHLAEDNPDLVLPHVVNIYFDPSEDYEVRIAAFSVLMASEPPLTLLERVLTELHDEDNNQVGSYTYSLLSDLANSTLPCDRKMAQKIQLVFAHAPDFDLGMQFSNTRKYTTYDDDNDYGFAAQSEFIASNVSNIPRAFYTALDMIRGPFQDSILELGGTVKGIDELVEKLFEPSGILSQIVSSLGSTVQVRNVPEVLDMVKNRLLFRTQDTDIPRAAVYYKLFGRTTYMTLDEQYVIEILEQAVEFFRQIDATSGYSANYVKVWMPASFFRAVPSAVGLPVVVNHRNPIILTASLGNTRIATNKQKQTPLSATFALSTDIDVSIHQATIVLAYVVDPANNKIHGSALEKTTEVAFATEIEVVIDLQKDTYALSLKPKLPHEVFYHNTRPSTFVARAVIITEPKEEWLEQVNEIETIPEPFKFDDRHEARALGLSLRWVGESENPWADIPLPFTDTTNQEGFFAALYEMHINPEMLNREIHVYLEPHRQNPVSEILFTVDYDKHLQMGLPKGPHSQEHHDSSSSEEEDYEKAVSSIYGRSYSVPDAKTTIQKLVQRTQATWAPVLGQGYSEPVPATVSHVVDMTMGIKGDHTKQHAWRAVYAHSLDFRSNWFELVGHRSSDEHDRPWQFCSSLVAVFPEIPNPFYVEMNTLKAQKAKIQAEAGWGTDCQRQNKINIEGVMEKSEQQLTSSSGIYESPKDQQSLPWYYKQCQVDRTEGLTQSFACQEAISSDSDLNVIKFDIIAPSLPHELLNMTYKLDLWSKYMFYPNLEINPFVSNAGDRVSFVLHYSEQVPEIPLIDVYVNKSHENLAYTKLWLPYYEPPSTLDSFDDVYLDQFYNDDYTPECNLMEDYLNTFDNVTVELPDNKCQYILAKDCSPDKAFTIIASQIDIEAKTKALSMALAGHSIKTLPPRGAYVPIVLNGKEIQVKPSKPIVLDFDKETELRVYVRVTSASTDTPILVVEAPYDDITVEYDGKNARIQLPRDFQGDHCGVCGDFNDEEYQEFVGPNGCLYVEEEDFVNSYAIPGQSCPEPPKPTGPAFCPHEVTYQIKHAQHNKNFQESGESAEIKKTKVPKHHPHHVSNEDVEPTRRPPHHTHERTVSPRVLHPTRPQYVESSEEVKRPKKPVPTTQDSNESDEDDKPSGSSDCIHAYTPTFEHDGKTCFATIPAYKCKSSCRAVRLSPKQMPFHCLPQNTQYEKILKEEARHGVVHQVQNKKAEKFRAIDFPEKCL